MKILIGYPPLDTKKGTPQLSQNRQFQFFSNPTFLFPVVLASAATYLKAKGHEVIWKDSVAEQTSMKEFFDILRKESPNVFAFETKVPILREQWGIINRIKKEFPSIKIVIMGDHVTSFPKETMENSQVDFVLTGGDFDFALVELADALENKKKIPIGIWYREKGKIKENGVFALKHNLDEAPFIDRELTKWKLYQKEYNLVGRPFFYLMSGRDCWWGRCKFCAWPILFPKFRVRSPENVLDEIGMLIEKYGIKEIFDDSGTLMVGDWLRELCQGLIKRGYNKKIIYSCNMRFGILKQEDYNLMKKAGFRLLKFGLESGNQKTLDKLDKGIKVEDIVKGCEMAKRAGLSPHLTMMVGYPWETKEDAMNTFKLAKELMQSGKADVLQATVLMAYPGTPLWKESVEKGWLLFDPLDYEKYDMSGPVLKTKNSDPREIAAICGKIYTIFLTPKYIFLRLKEIRSVKDVLFILKGAKAVVGHLRDFLIR